MKRTMRPPIRPPEDAVPTQCPTSHVRSLNGFQAAGAGAAAAEVTGAGGAAAVEGGAWARVTGVTESNTRKNPTDLRNFG